MSAVRDLYQEAIRLYNAGDIDGFANVHADDAVLVTPSGTVKGRAAIGVYWSDLRAAFPDLTLTVDTIVEQNDTIATEWHQSGTNTGPLRTRDGIRTSPTGKRIRHSGMELARVHDGKIVEYHIYWDRMAVARQLGRLPTPRPVGADRPSLGQRFDNWSVRHPESSVLRPLFRLPTVLWRLGLGPVMTRLEVRRGHLVMLTATGRSSGLPRHTPVTAHSVDGRTYLWCPYGRRAQWYRNITENPVVTVQSRGGARAMRAVGVDDVDEAAEVIASLRRFDETFLRSYLGAEGFADTPDDIARNARRLDIRRLEHTREEGPPALEADLAWLWLAAAAGATFAVARRHVRRGPASRSSVSKGPNPGNRRA